MTYIVKTMGDRNLIIKAESFEFRSTEQQYVFADTGKIVAQVPAHNVFAVLEEDAEGGDYYFFDCGCETAEEVSNV